MTTRSVFGPNFAQWKTLDPEKKGTGETSTEEISRIDQATNELKSALLSSMQMQHVVALAGSGTSLGRIGGPSMWTLWDHCVNSNAGSKDEREFSEQALDVINEVGYRIDVDDENIEALLSRCDAYLQVKDSEDVSDFVRSARTIILDMCSSFLQDAEDARLSSHRLFLHRLSRRRARDSRMKLFTTNYDLCFEAAAGKQGLVVIDGFSFSFPRRFDPRFFSYDIVRRPAIGDESSNPLEGVFHLYKLHGSTNWDRQEDGEIIMQRTTANTACLIYPARGKYQQSYVQPHLELVSQYLSALREPNTCLIVAGFGFNDDHLSEPILSAARTNPHMRLIVVDSRAQELTSAATNRYWREIKKLSQQGSDIWLINATFEQFSELIPDLKSLTPGDRLLRDIKMATGT
ncbi:SIR2 family protein [Pseudoxanthomonas jiangsuensis]|uniref:SIR2 family protein n=1 Tax=Pseudoxanthomonas jiangsuensis TaxID=619688 RepID=UPI00139073DE|nr:SIR2 family protein [Pseudoxanthomonas jiangsuensis]KAF1695195.1 SIR2 family protein [Pseudoxanthomonas jiangsuensis]